MDKPIGKLKLLTTEGEVVDAILYCHQETITLGSATFYLLKLDTPADASGTTLSASTGSVAAITWGKFVYSLSGIIKILAATIYATYRAYTGGGTVNAQIDIKIVQSNGQSRTTIATGVSKSANLGSAWATYTGANYSFAEYTVVADTDYLEIDYVANVTVKKANQYAYLRIDDNTLATSNQTRSQEWSFAHAYTVTLAESLGLSDVNLKEAWSPAIINNYPYILALIGESEYLPPIIVTYDTGWRIRENPVDALTPGDFSVTPKAGYQIDRNDSYGGGALFMVFDRSWLQGKTVEIDWEGAQSLAGNTAGRVGIWDGSYSESNDSDWGDYAIPVTKGAGELYDITHNTLTFSRVTDSFVVPSTGTLPSLTLWLDTYCGNNGQWTQFYLYSITIKDSSGNILKKWTFNSSTLVIWETSGTTKDYGYLQVPPGA